MSAFLAAAFSRLLNFFLAYNAVVGDKVRVVTLLLHVLLLLLLQVVVVQSLGCCQPCSVVGSVGRAPLLVRRFTVERRVVVDDLDDDDGVLRSDAAGRTKAEAPPPTSVVFIVVVATPTRVIHAIHDFVRCRGNITILYNYCIYMTLKERSIFRQWTATIRLYEWFWCAVMDTSTSASYCCECVVDSAFLQNIKAVPDTSEFGRIVSL